MSDEIEKGESLPEANESHEHKWKLVWKHAEAGRAGWTCEECEAKQWSDRGSVTVSPHAPWVAPEHVAMAEKARN